MPFSDGIQHKGNKGGFVVARFTGTGFLKLNTAGAAVGCNSAGETVQTMNIYSMQWSAGNGASWTIKRGANTVWTCDGQDYLDLSDGRLIDNVGGEPTANVVVTKNGTGPAAIVIKLHKIVAINGGSAY